MTEELLKKLHTAMCNDNEHQCNRLNNYIHTDEYLTAEVVQVVKEIVAEETKELKEKNKELTLKVDRLESACDAYNYSQRTYQEEIKELKELYKKADENWWNAQQTIKELQKQNKQLETDYKVLSCSVGDFGELQENLEEEQRKNNGLADQIEKMKCCTEWHTGEPIKGREIFARNIANCNLLADYYDGAWRNVWNGAAIDFDEITMWRYTGFKNNGEEIDCKELTEK